MKPGKLVVFIIVICINMIHAQPIVLNSVVVNDDWKWFNPYPFGGNFNSIEVIDAHTILAAANYGVIMRSTDSGSKWDQAETPDGFTDHITHIEFFPDKLNGFAIGGGKLLETKNGGKLWEINDELDLLTFQNYSGQPILEFQDSPTDLTLNSVYFINDSTGWAAGEDGMFLSTNDSGNTWTIPLNNINDLKETILDIQFVDEKVGWVAGIHGTIFRTLDAGITWDMQSSKVSNLLFASHFYDADTGWVVGVNQKILKTTNAGDDWIEQTAPFKNRNLQSIHFIDDRNGWIAGDNNVLLKTTDGGEYWYDKSLNNDMNFKSVYFSDEFNGWGVGENGRITKTSDGGESWENQDIRTGKDLESVKFANTSQGWLVGSTGAFFKTIDSGEYWLEFETGINERLLSVYFPHPDIGWLVGEGGRILRFNISKTFNPIPPEENYVFGLSEKDGQIYVTLTAGISTFSTVSNVVAVKPNPTEQWEQATIMLQGFKKLQGLNYPYQWGTVGLFGPGYIMENDQHIIFSDDKIKSVSSIPGTDDFLYINGSMLHKNNNSDVLGYIGDDPHTVYAINDSVYYTAGDLIYRTIDAGSTMENLGNAGVNVNDLDFLSEVVGFGAADSGRIIKTTVSGNLWFPALDPISSFDHITNVYFVSNRLGYMQTSNTRPTITYRSIYPEQFWTELNTVDTTFYNIDKFYVTPSELHTYLLDEDDSLYQIEADTIKSTVMHVRDFSFIDDNVGWYIDSNSIYKRTLAQVEDEDKPEWEWLWAWQWILQKEFENYPVFNTVFFRNASLGIIAGDYGKILKTTDGGNTWRDISVAGEHVKGVYFWDDNYGYAGDVNGGFYSTTDGGKTWIERDTESYGEINSIQFFSDKKGFAVSEKGILITTDGGGDLTLYDSPLYENTGNTQKTTSLYGRKIDPNNLFYARGKNILAANNIKRGTITSAHIDNLTDFTPVEYKLNQNFPNPFNAQTTISYTLPEVAHVTLKIYDILGRQTSVMENSMKDAGSYKVTFDASNIASGVYFYRLEAGNFFDIKKMILLK